jgi:hypothetical protein
MRFACQLRFPHDMVSEFPSFLPRGVTVAQVTLDHFVMVRIHARQPFDAPEACSWQGHPMLGFTIFSQGAPNGPEQAPSVSNGRPSGVTDRNFLQSER